MTSIIAAPATPAAEPAVPASPFQRFYTLAVNPWFAYATILALQLRVIWNVWQYKDLTSGDTSYYFANAWLWFSQGKTSMVMSPLYTIFYGSLLHLTSNVQAVTILHRMIIVLAAAALVLAVMRRLLPAPIAWLAAAWWVILPVNFDALYEVHQFAVIPILLIWLVALRKYPGTWTRAIVLAMMLATTLLVRNEMSIATGCFALVCLYDEWKRRKRSPKEYKLISTLAVYLTPLAALCLLLGWCWMHSDSDYQSFRAQMKTKHTLNMAQVYSFGYSQRHSDFPQSAVWTGFASLMTRDFGQPEPSLGQMIRHNPRAVAQHVLWNISLFPTGLQLLLFDQASGSITPDYIPVRLKSKDAITFSAITLGILLLGILIWYFERDKWKPWFATRRLGWAAMLCAVAVTPAIVATQRPRPEYLFSLSIFLMAVVATAVWIIISRLRFLARLTALMPIVMVAICVYMPSYYRGHHRDPMVLSHTYDRLLPFAPLIDQPDTVFLKGVYAPDLQNYLGHGHGTSSDYDPIFSDHRPGETLADLLDRHGVNLFYLDQAGFFKLEQLQSGSLHQFIDHGGEHGWSLISYEQTPPAWSMLFHRSSDTTSPAFSIPQDSPFSGWSAVKNFRDVDGPFPKEHLPIVRWAMYPTASIKVTAYIAGKYQLLTSSYESSPGQEMTILLDGRPIATHSFSQPGVFDDLDLTLDLQPGEHQIDFQFKTFVGNDHLGVLFRKLQFVDTADQIEQPTTKP